jgi:hypothetical protein
LRGGRPVQPLRAAAWVALLAHVAFGVFPYALTGLLAPPWGVAVVYGFWVALLGLGLLLFRVRPAWSLAVPFAALIGWIVILSIGNVWFGWTA